MSRLPYLSPDQLDEAQRAIYDAIAGGKRMQGRPAGELTTPKGGLRGPFNPWLYAAQVGDPAQALGNAVRFGTRLPGTLRELAILVVAEDWKARYEWFAHARIARKEGLDEAVIEAIRQGRRPEEGTEVEGVVHDFARELLESRSVSDALYARAVEHLGEAGVVELTTTLGYYVLVSMTLNVFEIALPEGEADPFA